MTPTPATEGLSPRCDAPTRCVTCADEGVVMTVVRAGADGLAECAGPDGRDAEVQTTLVGPVGPGDAVLVHAGVALTRLDPRGPA